MSLADVTSANVVGYGQTDAIYGYKAMGPMFATISGESYDIQSIKPVPPKGVEEIEPGLYFIYEISSGGAASTSYVYLPASEAPDGGDAGWFSMADDQRVVRTFLPGEAFAFDVDCEGAAMQTSGQVDLGEVVTPGIYGYKAMNNPFPVKMSIQDMTPVPPEGVEEIEPGLYFIYEISSGGAASTSYVYLPASEAPDGGDAGWFSMADDQRVVRDFEAGEGFAYDVDCEGAGLSFTCPVSL